MRGIRGGVLTFKDNPFVKIPEECYDYYEDGLVVVEDGHIIAVGDYQTVSADFPSLSDIDHYQDSLIMPGLVDCHSHYVQSPMIGSCGDTLLEWLNEYTFPTEIKSRDKKFADEVACMFFHQILSQGTTTANVFSTTFESSVDAFFEESERYNTRMISGKVLQDRNLPDALKDATAEESIELTEKLLRKWHNRGRQLYAVVPRFAPTSTPNQLRLAGELYQQFIDRGVYMHTHLDEAENEIEWVAELFSDQPNYTEVYRSFNLLGRRSIFAHCCIVKEEEWKLLHEYGCGAVHCPSSNLFLGDGEFKFWEASKLSRPVRFGIGTDVGGGTNFSVLRQLGEAYKVAMLRDRSLDGVRSLYLATRGGASVLDLEDKIGSLLPGHEADIAVIDLNSTEFSAWRMQFCRSVIDKMFVLTTLGLDKMVRATYVSGKKVYDRDRQQPFLYSSDIY